MAKKIQPFFRESVREHACRLNERQCVTQAKRTELIRRLSGKPTYKTKQEVEQLFAWLQVKQAGLLLRPW